MTKKEIAAELEKFIKAHKPDEFKSIYTAVNSFWDDQHGFVNRQTYITFNSKVARWWWSGKSPLSESDILSSMNTNYVTHKSVQVHACRHECSDIGWWNNCFTNSNVVDVLFDLSFKYNIIGVEQKPGDLRIWIKESEDHQTNITGDVVVKIAKCLEFQV